MADLKIGSALGSLDMIFFFCKGVVYHFEIMNGTFSGSINFRPT